MASGGLGAAAPRGFFLGRSPDLWSGFFTVFEASEREHLLRILSNLRDLSHQYRLYFYSLPELGPHRLANYHRIYQACRDRDAETLLNAFRVTWGQRDHMLI